LGGLRVGLWPQHLRLGPLLWKSPSKQTA